VISVVIRIVLKTVTDVGEQGWIEVVLGGGNVEFDVLSVEVEELARGVVDVVQGVLDEGGGRRVEWDLDLVCEENVLELLI